MSQTPVPATPGPSDAGAPPATPPPVAVDQGILPAEHLMSEVGSLLDELKRDSSSHAVLPPVVSETADNQLVEVRLGMASSLFAALRCKHAATAGHALRVALTCSTWAVRLGLEQEERDAIEVAALLHDIGVIGVPDAVLLKPGQLNSNEAALVARSRRKSLDILRHSCSSQAMLDIVEHVSAWYNGARPGFRLQGEQLPLGARMITVAEAFDAMTTDHVFRPAMSHERAMTELFDCAGMQFDPELVRRFAELLVSDQSQLHREAAQRWLRSLDPELVNSCWHLNCVPSTTVSQTVDSMFQAKLLENMYDAVVFIDAAGHVELWNRGAERLTGISGSSVYQRQWHPNLLNMADEKGDTVDKADCPVHSVIRTGVQSLRRLTICGRNERTVAVDAHTIPVIAEDGETLGAILLFHDASSETSLEQRCQSLHEKATRDPLTQVANRAEFDRVHAMFVSTHQEKQVPCSLIIGDLDRFKHINDTWGHQPGDEVLKSVAALLKGSCRPGDLVARYGGEEFVLLCADCDNAAAARRAEEIRKALSELPQPSMDGRPATISFGVTEIQPGDTPETMLRRADRALLTAKVKGRNCVVQLGTGFCDDGTESKTPLRSRKSGRLDAMIEQVLTTPVPIKMAVEKLRGFVADHRANIVKISGNHVRLHVADQPVSRLRRLTDRPVNFRIDLRFEEERFQWNADPPTGGGLLRTKIYLSISTARGRDRRRAEASDRAKDVLVSFRSYLMASIDEYVPTGNVLTRARRMFTPWLGKS